MQNINDENRYFLLSHYIIFLFFLRLAIVAMSVKMVTMVIQLPVIRMHVKYVRVLIQLWKVVLQVHAMTILVSLLLVLVTDLYIKCSRL